MQIDTRKVYDVLVVDMSGRLDNASAGDAGDRLVEIVQGDARQVLLNLERVDYVSSAGLRIILRGAKLLQNKRGEMKICSANPDVTGVLVTSGFNSLVKFYTTEKDAFAAFQA